MRWDAIKAPKIALCRVCHGMGITLKTVEHPSRLFMKERQETTKEACLRCGGSGRVTVSAEIELGIQPYRPKEQGE